MSNYINSWLENFERQAMIRRALIVSGNIIDLSFDHDNELSPINEILEKSLKRNGFEKVVFYSRLNGISGISRQEWDELAHVDFTEEEGEPYGDDFNNAELGCTPIEPVDFFETVKSIMTKTKQKIAFIIDWSNYLFGQVNSLSEAERAWLQQIATSLRDAKTFDRYDEISDVQSLLIFLCSGNVALPPAAYLHNPLFAEITIPLPSMREREEAILARRTRWKIKEELRKDSQALADFVVLTDTLMLRDIDNLVRLSRQQEEILSLRNLVSLYRYGKHQSPWEQLDYKRLEKTESILKERVKGQDQAIHLINKILVRAYTGLSGLQHSIKARTPKGALFFVGPTGVGKTELAKSLAAFLFGDEDACIRFDMSEFNHEHADQRFVGAPPGYVGFEKGGQLTNAVKNRPFSLLLFDEIEKAHPRILDKFLQILEDGRLTDGKGETISFADTFIVFTSNIGASDIRPDSKNIAEQFKEAVQNYFRDKLNRPELLGRIGEANIVPFNFMQNYDVLKDIARAKLEPLKNRLKEKWGILAVEFEDEDEALSTLVKRVNLQHGGRGVLNILIEALFDPMAEFIFREQGKGYSFRDKTLYISKAATCFEFECR